MHIFHLANIASKLGDYASAPDIPARCRGIGHRGSRNVNICIYKNILEPDHRCLGLNIVSSGPTVESDSHNATHVYVIRRAYILKLTTNSAAFEEILHIVRARSPVNSTNKATENRSNTLAVFVIASSIDLHCSVVCTALH